MTMQLHLTDNLSTINADSWNALENGLTHPFLRHEFLAGLEHFGCVGEQWGWLPRHIIACEDDRLVGALPLYEKHNAYGELVFDWNWADAFQRAGLRYYPKLVSAIPYSPVTGPRLLAATDGNRIAIKQALLTKALELTRESGSSSLHLLFPDATDIDLLQQQGLLRRTGSQFHWFNRGYHTFDDYLTTFNSQRRKKVKRERRRVQEAGITVDILDGYQATEEHWDTWHRFYCSTFERHSGYATLSRDFFAHLGQTMPEALVLVLASYQGRYVAGALSLRSDTALYGRHWGCDEAFHSLHFELCYYAGIEYAIQHGLARFEPGAQGEHKVWRGFEPVPTWSAHWLANPEFARAIAHYLDHEHALMLDYMSGLNEHLPFKSKVP